MKRTVIASALTLCLLLTGCSSSVLNRTYSTVTEHSSKYWESESADTLRAENYQDVVNDLLLLIGQHTENASLRLYGFEDDNAVSETLEKATTEVQQETPMGAYAVKYITSSSKAQHGYYAASVHISYRRTAEQVQDIVNATSAAALADLLDAAMEKNDESLSVRIGYWTKDSRGEVQKTIQAVRKKWNIADTQPWSVSYYPPDGEVGLIEFIFHPTDETAEGNSSAKG